MSPRTETAAALAALHCAFYAAFTSWCPDAYMDETLHVPQAQRYCHGEFQHWDPKITTLPGTYLLSGLALFPKILWQGSEACTVAALRGVNCFVLSPLVFWFASKALREVHASGEGTSRALDLRLWRLALMPLHFFFCFLYYTDVASSGLVLVMYWLHRRRCFRLSAIAGAAAVVMRQTNIVWVWGHAVHVFSGPGGLRAWAERLGEALLQGSLLLHAAVGAGFVAFVLWNGGLVVGDRQNHAAVVHTAMLPYLAAFVLFFLGPASWMELLARLPRARLRAAAEGFAAAVCFALMTRYGSYAHPFLLADNRHITFYLWKDLLRRSVVRTILLPLALGLVVVAVRTPGKRQLTLCNSREVALWGLCCALVVIPTPLLEFRYFVVPTMFALLHQPLGTVRDEAAGVAVSALINIAVIAVFLFRPFHSAAWGEEPQRFMW